MSHNIDGEIKTSLITRLDSLTPDSKARWGKMNVVQMLTHMNDAFRISLGMKDAINKSNLFTRYVMFPFAVYVIPKWPRGTMTAAEMNQEKLGSKARDFYTELEFLKKMIDVFNEREGSKLKPHPMMGSLNKKQWRDLFVKHLKHHLEQFGV
jgi:hypothetical protein